MKNPSRRFLLLAPALLLLGCETHDRMVFDRGYRPSGQLAANVAKPRGPQLPPQTDQAPAAPAPAPLGLPALPGLPDAGAAELPAEPTTIPAPTTTAPGTTPPDPFAPAAPSTTTDTVPQDSAPAEPPGF